MESTQFPWSKTVDHPRKLRNSRSVERLPDASELKIDSRAGATLKSNFLVTKYSYPARLPAVHKEPAPKLTPKVPKNHTIESYLSRFTGTGSDLLDAKAERRGVMGWKLSMSRPTPRPQQPKVLPTLPLRCEGVRVEGEVYLQYLQFKHRRTESSV